MRIKCIINLSIYLFMNSKKPKKFKLGGFSGKQVRWIWGFKCFTFIEVKTTVQRQRAIIKRSHSRLGRNPAAARRVDAPFVFIFPPCHAELSESPARTNYGTAELFCVNSPHSNPCIIKTFWQICIVWTKPYTNKQVDW